jgi:ShET2 enterotoxin, N-terminal region
MYAETPKKADFFRAVDGPQAIRAAFEGELAGLHERHRLFMAETPESAKRLVCGSGLGGYLAQVANALREQPPPCRGEPRQADILLNTINHALAIQVQRKLEPDRGGEYFSVSLYDPNRTTNHSRVEAAHADDLQRLELSAFIPSHIVADYAFGSTELHMAAYCRGADLKPDASPIRESEPVQLGRQLSMAMRGNLGSAVEALLAELPKHSLAGQRAILGGARIQGATALYLAMQEGNAAPVKAYTGALLGTDLTPRDKQALLRGGTDEAPALYIAMQRGQAEAVAHFTQAVAATTQLNARQKVALLAGKRDNGHCSVAMALLKNQAAAVAAYGASVLQCEALSADQKLELLRADDGNGEAALAQAMSDRTPARDAINAFCDAVTRSDLSAAHKAELLVPRGFRFF